MPRLQHHPLALFSLVPRNPRAHDVVAHPSNSHLVTISPDNGIHVLDVGFNIRSQSRSTLATLGRNDTDIIIEGSAIARLQCSFEIDLDSGVVMLYDRSNGRTTQVYGERSTQFEYGRPRRVVVQEDLNAGIGMGGVGCNLVQFELMWHVNSNDKVEKFKSYEDISDDYEDNPRFARTVDDAPTIPPSQMMTRIHTTGVQTLRMRWAQIGPPLGSGQFGTVYKCVNVDSGKLMAVKILKRPSSSAGALEQEEWRQSLYYALKREVETLSQINHAHIVDYVASQGWDEPEVEIFMGLKEGTLESLLQSGSHPTVPMAVLYQMLQALDCLSWKGIIHRDVKPENILYISLPNNRYQFQLGDFGLCNRVVNAASSVGTPLYGAPELRIGGAQTDKLDVWSLFVTMLWTLDVADFRQRSTKFKNIAEITQTILLAASTMKYASKFGEMAILDPTERASAAQMLVKCFGGKGLTTPRSHVPALTSRPSLAITPGPSTPTDRTMQTKPRVPKNAAPGPSTPTSRTTQTKPKVQKNANTAPRPSTPIQID